MGYLGIRLQEAFRVKFLTRNLEIDFISKWELKNPTLGGIAGNISKWKPDNPDFRGHLRVTFLTGNLEIRLQGTLRVNFFNWEL